MKYAICNELFGDMPWSESFRLAKKHGYTGIEVAPFTLGKDAMSISPTTRQDFVRTAKEEGVEILGLHWLLAKTEGYHLTTRDEHIREKTARYLIELVQLCRDLGGDLMVLGSPLQRNFGPDMTHEEASKNAQEVLRAVVPALQENRVRIAVEPLGPQEGNFLNHASQARALIEHIGSPWIQLHLDVKAMSSEGIPIPELIHQNQDIMIHFHANDPNKLGPGMGEVPFVPIFQALQDVDYQGWVSVEVFDYSPGIETILEKSMRCMKESLAACR
ncbi:MAG: sugar phosphate isomerase/epimerase family protein [Pirellulales bacterium]